jgi:uncharacterized protein
VSAKKAGAVPASPLVELGIGAAWLVGLASMLSILEQLMGPGSLGTALLGAVAIDLLAGRAGVRWEWDEAPLDARRHAVRRVAAGAAVALGAGTVAVGIAWALRWCHGEGAQPSWALAFAVARAAAIAVRDELLFRGLPLAAAARARVPASIAQAFAALVSGAAVAMIPGVTPAAVALAVGSGWLFAALWARDRGAWAAVGGHAGWLLFVGSVLHGGLFDIDWTTGNLAAGASAAGAPAWVAAGVLVAAGFAVGRLPWPSGGGGEPRPSGE